MESSHRQNLILNIFTAEKIWKKRPVMANLNKIKGFLAGHRKRWSVVISVIRLGDFRKFAATNLLTRVALILGNFSASLNTSFFVIKTAVATIWATFGKF